MERQGASFICRGNFVAILEEHRRCNSSTLWRYVLRYSSSGETIYDGWAGDLREAQDSAEKHLAYLCNESQQV
jgi:hypothetical protein